MLTIVYGIIALFSVLIFIFIVDIISIIHELHSNVKDNKDLTNILINK